MNIIKRRLQLAKEVNEAILVMCDEFDSKGIETAVHNYYVTSNKAINSYYDGATTPIGKTLRIFLRPTAKFLNTCSEGLTVEFFKYLEYKFQQKGK